MMQNSTIYSVPLIFCLLFGSEKDTAVQLPLKFWELNGEIPFIKDSNIFKKKQGKKERHAVSLKNSKHSKNDTFFRQIVHCAWP